MRHAFRATGLALVVFAVAALAGPGRIDSEDGQARFEAGLNLLAHGDASIRDSRVVWHRFPGRGGHDATYYRIPGEAVAVASIVVADALGPPDEGWRHFIYSLNGAVAAALLAVLYAAWFRRQGVPRPLLWAFAGIVCTPSFHYAASTFDDLLGTLAVVLAMVAADRSRTSLAWLVIAALAVGLSLNCKQPLAAVLLPTLALADCSPRRGVRAAVLILGFVLGYACYVGYETWKFPPGEKAKHAAIMAEQGLTIFGGKPLEALLDYAAGPSSGTLWYAPASLLGLAGLLAAPRKLRVAMLLALAAMVGFFSLLTFYKGGVCWGPRYLTPVFGLLWLFAPQGAARLGRPLTGLLLSLGFIVQILGLALVPERLYVERNVPSGFYTVDPWLYFQPSISHILNRPREIADSWQAPPSPEFTPAPTPTFTMPVFDPPFYNGPKGIEGVRKYSTLNTFRPWWLTYGELNRYQRPFDVVKVAMVILCIGALGLLIIFWWLNDPEALATGIGFR